MGNCGPVELSFILYIFIIIPYFFPVLKLPRATTVNTFSKSRCFNTPSLTKYPPNNNFIMHDYDTNINSLRQSLLLGRVYVTIRANMQPENQPLDGSQPKHDTYGLV